MAEKNLSPNNISVYESLASELQENIEKTLVTLTSDQIVNNINSPDPKLQYLAAQSVRKILCRPSPPIDDVLNLGVVPDLIKFLDNHEYPELQFEACWTLTNLASGTTEQTRTVVDAGCVPKLASLLESPVSIVVDQAVWTLSNIAGDGSEMRDLVLNNNVVERLIALPSADIPLNDAQNIVDLMLNLCRGKNPYPPFYKIKPLLPILVKYLSHCDPTVITHVCWALSYISDVDNDQIQAIIEIGALPQLIKYLNSPELQVVTPALCTIGNIVTGTHLQTDAVLEAGVLPYLKQLLNSPKQEIVKMTAWTISNIAAGSRIQVQRLFEIEIFHEILHVLGHGDFQSQREAAWTITNTITGGSFKQVVDLFKLLLDVTDDRTMKVILNGLENMFSLTEQNGCLNELRILIEEANGLEKLKLLLNHANEEVCQKAYEIIENYFSDGFNVHPTNQTHAQQSGVVPTIALQYQVVIINQSSK